MSIHYLIYDFDEVKTDLTRTFSMDDEDAKALGNISKAEPVSWNGVMMKLNKCCNRTKIFSCWAKGQILNLYL